MTDVARPIRVRPGNGGKNIGTHRTNSIGNDTAVTTWLTTLRDKYGHCCLCRSTMNRGPVAEVFAPPRTATPRGTNPFRSHDCHTGAGSQQICRRWVMARNRPGTPRNRV